MAKQRYEKEIEEILQRLDPGPPKPRAVAPRRPALGSTRGRSWSLLRLAGGLDPGRVMLWSFGVLLLALLLQGGAPGMARPVALLGGILLLTAYVLSFTSGGGRREMRWRGRTIDLSRTRSPLGEWGWRLARWFRSR